MQPRDTAVPLDSGFTADEKINSNNCIYDTDENQNVTPAGKIDEVNSANFTESKPSLDCHEKCFAANSTVHPGYGNSPVFHCDYPTTRSTDSDGSVVQQDWRVQPVLRPTPIHLAIERHDNSPKYGKFCPRCKDDATYSRRSECRPCRVPYVYACTLCYEMYPNYLNFCHHLREGIYSECRARQIRKIKANDFDCRLCKKKLYSYLNLKKHHYNCYKSQVDADDDFRVDNGAPTAGIWISPNVTQSFDDIQTADIVRHDLNNNSVVSPTQAIKENGQYNLLGIRKLLCKKCKLYYSDCKADGSAQSECPNCEKTLLQICRTCCEYFPDYNDLLAHVNKFPCSYCDFTSCRRSERESHELNAHKGNVECVFECQICGKGLPTHRHLNSHFQDCHPYANLTDYDKPPLLRNCEHCQITLENEAGTSAKRDLACYKCLKKMTWKCGKCGCNYESVRTLKSHLQFKCNVKQTFKCFKCDYTSSNNFHVIRHFKRIHGSQKDSSGYSLTARRCEHCKVTIKYGEKIYLTRCNSCENCGRRMMWQCTRCNRSYQTFESIRGHATYLCSMNLEESAAGLDFANRYDLERNSKRTYADVEP